MNRKKRPIWMSISLFLFLALISVNVSAITWEYDSFGGKADVLDTIPSISGEIPANESTDIITTPVVNVTVNDGDSSTVDVYFYENTTGSWVLQQSNMSVDVSVSSQNVSWDDYNNASAFDTTYWWCINVTDGSNYVNETYWFTTMVEPEGNWYSVSFGGSAEVYGYSWDDWSDWWTMYSANVSAPADFTAENYNNSVINITWTNIPGTDKVSIVSKKDSSPANHSDGNEVYNNSAEYYNDTGLDPGTHYYYKAWQWNDTAGLSSDNSTSNNWTSPGNPSSFSNTSVTNVSIDLEWTNGTNHTNNVVRYQTGSYPANPQSGTEGYNNTENSTTVSTLTPDTPYYFRLWSFANGLFSESYEQMITTTYADLDPPTNFNVTIVSVSSLNLSWTTDDTADSTSVIRKKGSSPANHGDGAEVYNSTGSYSVQTSLHPGTHYYYKAWSYNTTLGLSTSSIANDSYTPPGNPTNFKNTSNNANDIDFSWNNGTNTSRAVIRYQAGSYPTTPQSGSAGYNGTGNTTNIGSLSGNTTYFFRLWCFVNPFSDENMSVSITTLETFVPDPPYNGSADYSPGGFLNITWNRGNGSDEDVVIRKSGSYPTTYTDGTEVDRTSNNSGGSPLLYYYNESGVVQAYYYCVFSHNTTNISYSSPLQIPQYSALGINCFNESNPSQAINFDILITNDNASQTFSATDISNTYWIDIGEIPYGTDTIFVVSNSSYQLRTYYYDILLGEFYNLTFYLPPIETPGGGPSGGVDPVIRTFTNVISVTNPGVDAEIPLTHAPEDIIGVYTYEVLYNTITASDSASVTDPDTNVSIPFSHTYDAVTEVYVYNDTIYGGWIPVAEDKYSLNATHCEVDDSVLDDNSTIARVDYYYYQQTLGQWLEVPDNNFTSNNTHVVIDAFALSSNTSMAKVDYTYWYYENASVETKLYILRVIDEFETAVKDATITIRRYISSTDSFETISILKTDANGQVEVYLIPNVLYKIFIEAEEYHDIEISEWIPDEEFYGISYPKTFKVTFETGTDTETEELFDGITWAIEPAKFYHNGSFTVWFNISSDDNKIEWYNGTLYYWNITQVAWEIINTTNISASPGGGSISFGVPNITGRYTFLCMFKKENFSYYAFGAEDGCRIFFVYWASIEQQVATIPGDAYLVITIVFTLLVIGFLVKFGAGANAGIAGLAVMGGMFALRPDLSFGNPAISVWYIFLATAIAYFVIMFINRRS